MKTTCIYTIADEFGVIRYVGKSNNPSKRIFGHLKEGKGTHKYNWLQLIISRGGFPIVEIIDEVPSDDWEQYEIYWISQFRTWGFDLINQSIGGIGPGGVKRSELTKQKMGKSRIGIPLSESHKQKISDGVREKVKDSPNYNKCYDKTHIIDKDLLYQKYITENLSMPKLAKLLGVSEKVIFTNLKEFGIKKDKSVWREQLITNPIKIVCQFDIDENLIREWPGVSYIRKETGLQVSGCCCGRAKTAGGFIWKFKIN